MTIALWLPLGVILFSLSLTANLSSWAIVYSFLGGARGVARRTTQPRIWNFFLRWMYSLIDVFNVVEIGHAWDEKQARQCFEAFAKRNNFSGDDTRFEVRTISDSLEKPDIVQKFHRLDLYPARYHHVWVLCAPSRTFIASLTNFAEFDGTSCFNLVKGFVHTYYEKGNAPLVRPQKGNKELDLQLDQDDKNLCNQLSAWLALKVCFQSAFQFGVSFGRWILSREVFDLLACPCPTTNCVIETLDVETNAKLTEALKRRGGKMFSHIMTCSAQALSESPAKLDDVLLLTQMSCQSRYYKPKVSRNVAGNWLIAVGGKVKLSQLSSRSWAAKYKEKLQQHITNFSGEAARAFINQSVFGFWGASAFANTRLVYWFNNYGLRDMHPGAGGVTYHWGPNYSISCYCLVNVVTVDGAQCITLLSSVIPPGELKKVAARMKQLMIDTCDEPWVQEDQEDLVDEELSLDTIEMSC